MFRYPSNDLCLYKLRFTNYNLHFILYIMNKIIEQVKSILRTPFRNHAKNIEKLYEQYEHIVGPIAMLVGVTVDFFAFRRIDLLFDTLVLIGYLVIATAGITLVNLYEGGIVKGKILNRMSRWLPLTIQFSFGGLFSAFFVFYIKSASFVTSWPFFVVLLFLLVGNEFFRERYMRLTFNISIYFLALFSFTMFYMPILTKSVGIVSFIISGLISIGLIVLFVVLLYRAIPKRILKAKHALIWSIFSIYVGVNFLYAYNIIPPIPLALKESGVYHNIVRSGAEYIVQGEEKKWYSGLTHETIHITEWEPVYVFTSIFAPTDLKTPVIHHWQYKDSSGNWVTSDQLKYPIIGGRDGGYRGYSFKYAVFPGEWRVDIETESGQVVGRVRFDIERVDQQPILSERKL